MVIKKYNEATFLYDDYAVPQDRKILMYSAQASTPCNCVNCGKEITYGLGHRSHRYKSFGGYGFMECSDCYYAFLPIYCKLLDEHKIE